MQTFYFITNDEFRAALERDYQELERCKQASAWKAVVVLAGSVVEAMLVDALAATDYQKRTKGNPLEMQLAELIAACKAEHLLSQRSADLCSAVRSYRNLIHPGRVIRLQDKADENGANIAASLIPVIAEEIAAQREKTYGLTAIQLLSKLERDPSSVAILKHLLTELNEIERERLLMKLIPERRAQVEAEMEDPADPFSSDPLLPALRDRLGDCYRVTFEGASKELKTKVAGRYVMVLKTGSEEDVFSYDRAFFRCTDLEYLAAPEIAVVKLHILSRMKVDSSLDTLTLVWGLEKHLTPADIVPWLNPILQHLASGNTSDGNKRRIIEFVEKSYYSMPEPTQAELLRTLKIWEDHLAKRGNDETAESLKTLQATLTEDFPF